MDTEIVIIGGGPVGLYLGLELTHRDIPFQLFEVSRHPHTHSRSIGIHPPILEQFESLDLTSSFLERGLPIRRGHAFHNQEPITTIDFNHAPAPYQFVLALPQHQTETILRETLQRRRPHSVHFGWKATSVDQNEDSARLELVNTETGRAQYVTTQMVIACDGLHSRIRKQAHFAWRGQRYPDNYMMGDTDDTTDFNSDAAIFLHQEGLIESFPLPDDRRRWVAKTDSYVEQPDYSLLAHIVHHRTGIALPDSKPYMLSSFGVQHQIANPMANGLFWLAGDAAHVVSPIGGQGMNLGWMGARTLADKLEEVRNGYLTTSQAAQQYSSIQSRRAQTAGKRAEMNMKLGRRQQYPGIYRLMLKLGLSTPTHPLLTRLFTMRQLEHSWI
ncbi:MAG: FAD-dependent oxidoreductase [Bacteroidota bacterium]